MFWVLCSGAPWRDLPERYGSWKTVYNRFNRWSKSGVINIIFNRLLSLLDANGFMTGLPPRWMAVISGR
ncbi:putative transposase [Shigella dysenteriae 155-74]|nr:putative transposase [Shigella dysenteriae 155-74]